MDRRSPQRARNEVQSAELSVSSAIDLPIGLTATPSEPQTPVNLSPSREGSISRRRLSWGRMERQDVDAYNDPLRLGWGETTVETSVAAASAAEDPFEVDMPDEEDFTPRIHRERYPMTRLNGPSVSSQASLVQSFRTKSTSSGDFNEQDLDDDEARLTSFASTVAGRDRSRSANLDPSMASDMDLERTPDTRTSKQRNNRYSVTPSPASRLRTMKHTLRRVSVRVVNLAGRGVEEKGQPIRLPDDDDQKDGDMTNAQKEERELTDMDDIEELPDLESKMPLRGRTLGLFGPSNSIRLAMFRFLTFRFAHDGLSLVLYSL